MDEKEAEARPIMGTIFLVSVYHSVPGQWLHGGSGCEEVHGLGGSEG